MRGHLPFLLTATLAIAGADTLAQSRQTQDGRKTYSWVDERGVRHYGDSVPAQYATREQRVLNNQGVEVQRRDAQKTLEEIARETELNREASRRKQHDMFLLSTYSSVRDLENVRDERLDTLNAQLRAAQAYIDNLDDRMRGLRERAMMFRPYNDASGARRMPDQLAEEIIRTLSELRTQGRTLDAKRAEHTALREKFDLDIVRYRELKSGKIASATAQR